MALNLIRNSRVFFTTHVDSNGKVKDTGFTDSNTFEIQVQDGFSFSQNSAQETVTLNEAGATPIRGQRSFNTSLEPADWSFSTYMRPRYVEGTVTAGYDADDIVACEESVLWGAISSSDGAGWVTSTSTSTFTDKRASYATFSGSNKHQLQPFGLVIKFDNSAYIIDNCVLDTATIDFGIDAIASIAWAGKGMNVREATIVLDATTASFHVTVSPTPVAAGVYKPKNTTAPYIANKLSTMTLTSNAATPVIYTVALTGGSLSIANNVTYLTPANLGTLNVPCTYFTGTRTITSNVTAYLKTGTGSPSALLADLLTANSTENKFSALISIGGSVVDTNKVELVMPTTMLTIPTLTTEQVISTAITLTAQGSELGTAGSTYNIEKANELTVKYYAVPT
jgi:hypothetical protein